MGKEGRTGGCRGLAPPSQQAGNARTSNGLWSGGIHPSGDDAPPMATRRQKQSQTTEPRWSFGVLRIINNGKIKSGGVHWLKMTGRAIGGDERKGADAEEDFVGGSVLATTRMMRMG